MKTLRTFISIEPDLSTKKGIKEFINKQKLNSNFANIRWVKPENFHITLAFLGNVPKNKIPMLQTEFKDVISLYSPFSINLSGIGGFPSCNNPKILWIGIEKNTDLINLKKDIDKKLRKLGFKFNKKPFFPHITIGRQKNMIFGKTINDLEFKASFLVKKINLVKSELTKSGAVYTIVFSEYLKNNI